jgi:hypothetical protein
MAYVGTPIDTRNTFQSLQGKRFNGDGSTTAFTLDVAPSSTLDIEVFVGNVRQDPNSAYTLSGTTLTFTGAPPSGTNNIYVVHQAKSVGTIDPPAGATIDMNGVELFLDADADTSITADTDDQIDFKAGGTDVMSMTATGLTINDGTTITTADNTDTLTLTSTDADANSGPNLRLYRNSSSPADSDSFGQIDFEGRNDNSQDFVGVQIIAKSGDVSDGSEDAQIEFDVMTGGTLREYMRFASGSQPNVTFNEDSQDIDFIVESNGNANAIFLDANNERLNIASSSSGSGVAGAHFGIDTFLSQFVRNGSVPVEISRNTNDGSLVDFVQAGTTEGTVSVSGSTVSYNAFCGSHWSRLADNSKPTILRGTVMESIATMMTWYQAVADVEESTDSKGRVTPAYQVKEDIIIPDGKSIGDAVTFTSSDDKKEYTGVYAKEDNERLPMCKVSDTANSKAVYGVFMAWNDNDDGLDGDVNDMYVAALGAFVVRIHKDETVAIGDYLQSKGDGTAKKQADDILRASTIAKVISTEKTITHSDGSYCVPCTLHCG